MNHRTAARLASALLASGLLALAEPTAVSAALGAQTTRGTAASRAKAAKTAAAKKAAAAKVAAKKAAATPAPTAATDSVYTDVQVDTLAEPNPATFAPRYPAALRARHVGGTVVVQFVVDTAGRPEMQTFKVLSSSDTAFTTAVRSAVAATDFFPALLGGRKVRQLYEQPFTFAVDSVARARGSRPR